MTALEELLADLTAGDPVTGLKWTHRSLDRLGRAPGAGGPIGATTLARLMHDRGFSLRTCRKNKAGTTTTRPDRQFRYLVRMRSCIGHGDGL